MGINFIDTIVVRRSLNKGTSSTYEPTSPSEFMGTQNKQNTDDRMKLAGDLWIMSGKGTTKIRLSDMRKPKSVDIKGHYISTGKGTGRVKI
ncbi:MAG: hypothetical protein ACQ9CV_08380 [Nitrosopumilus sp.]|jgi:hypothetical protein